MNVEKKLALSFEELDAERLAEEDPQAAISEEGDSDSGEEKPIYNPKAVPLGWYVTQTLAQTRSSLQEFDSCNLALPESFVPHESFSSSLSLYRATSEIGATQSPMHKRLGHIDAQRCVNVSQRELSSSAEHD